MNCLLLLQYQGVSPAKDTQSPLADVCRKGNQNRVAQSSLNCERCEEKWHQSSALSVVQNAFSRRSDDAVCILDNMYRQQYVYSPYETAEMKSN